MVSDAPLSWREDLQAAAPLLDSEGAVWIGNLNEMFPWRNVVGNVRLVNGQDIILKYHTDPEDMRREWAAVRFLKESGAPLVAPECFGGDETRKVLVFERLIGRELIGTLLTRDEKAGIRTAGGAV